MKNCVTPLFILLFLSINGYANANSLNDAVSNTASLKKYFKETIDKKSKTSARLTNKNKLITRYVKAKKPFLLTKASFSQSMLDLTVPLKVKKTYKANHLINSKKNHYLPDLFNDQKDGKNGAIQVIGRFIKREEVEIGKERIADGAGIDIKLLH